MERVRSSSMLDQEYHARSVPALRHDSFPALLGGNPRTSLDILVPYMDYTEATGGLTNFMEGHRHSLREVHKALERMREEREKERQHHNATIQWPSAGIHVAKVNLVPAWEIENPLHWQEMAPWLVHKQLTGPWTAMDVVFECLGVIIVIKGRATRSRTVSTVCLKPFDTKTSGRRHPLEDEFAQFAWGADLGLT